MAPKRPSLGAALRAGADAVQTTPAPVQAAPEPPAPTREAPSPVKMTPGKAKSGRPRTNPPKAGRTGAPAVVTKISPELLVAARAAHAADHAAGRTNVTALEAWVDEAVLAHVALTPADRAALPAPDPHESAALTRRYRLEPATDKALDEAVEADKALGIRATRGNLARDAIRAAVARTTAAEGGKLPEVSDEDYERAVARNDTKTPSRAGEPGVTITLDKDTLDAARAAYWYDVTRPGAEGISFRGWVDAALRTHNRATPSTRHTRAKRVGTTLGTNTFPRRFPLAETTASDMLAAIRADRLNGHGQTRTHFALTALRVAIERTHKAAAEAGDIVRPAPDPLPSQPA